MMVGVEIGVRRDLAGAPWEVLIADGEAERRHLFDDFDALTAALPYLLLRKQMNSSAEQHR